VPDMDCSKFASVISASTPVSGVYRETLSKGVYVKNDGTVFDPSSLQELNVRYLARGSIDDAIERARSILADQGQLAPGPTSSKVALDAARADLAALESAKAAGAKLGEGSLYQARLKVKPEELLDWDRPLSEQPEGVRKVLEQLVPKPGTSRLWDDRLNAAPNKGETIYQADGSRFYRELDSGGGKVAEKFRAAGIKGIRYKDAGSRGAEGGTYNYVIFDDKLVEILKRYGVAMTAGAGGAMIVSGQNMPPEVAAQIGPQA